MSDASEQTRAEHTHPGDRWRPTGSRRPPIPPLHGGRRPFRRRTSSVQVPQARVGSAVMVRDVDRRGLAPGRGAGVACGRARRGMLRGRRTRDGRWARKGRIAPQIRDVRWSGCEITIVDRRDARCKMHVRCGRAAIVLSLLTPRYGTQATSLIRSTARCYPRSFGGRQGRRHRE